MPTLSDNKVLAMVLRNIADDLESTPANDEWDTPEEMLHSTLNNVAHDFGGLCGDEGLFFTRGG